MQNYNNKMLDFVAEEELGQFAYHNCEIVKTPVKGICVDFFGMNFNGWIPEHTEMGLKLAGEGIAYFQPYLNPWAWGNDEAIQITDRIIDEIKKRFGLDENIPVVSCGGSMGGYTCLVYTVLSKHNIISCLPNAGVSDLMKFMKWRAGGTPRALFTAFYNEAIENNMTFAELLHARSPIFMLDRMPKIPYRVFHSDGDELVPVAQAYDLVE